MRIQELLEGRPWNGFTGSQVSRIWLDPKTGEAITVNDDGNHSVAVTNNPAQFGLSPGELEQAGLKPGERAYDYDGRALYPAMRKGWVRIYLDVRNPDNNSNIEAASWGGIRRGLIWFSEQIGTPKQITVVLRHGLGDKDGEGHRLDNEKMEQVIKFGRLGRDRMPQTAEPTLVKQMNNTPHAFRKV